MKAPVFDTTYEDYLNRIAGMDLRSCASILGGQFDGDALVIPFYGRPYRISAKGVLNLAVSFYSFFMESRDQLKASRFGPGGRGQTYTFDKASRHSGSTEFFSNVWV